MAIESLLGFLDSCGVGLAEPLEGFDVLMDGHLQGFHVVSDMEHNGVLIEEADLALVEVLNEGGGDVFAGDVTTQGVFYGHDEWILSSFILSALLERVQ